MQPLLFCGENFMENNNGSKAQFTGEQGRSLVDLAKHTIMEKLGRKINKLRADKLAAELTNSKFQESCGTFVTINIEGKLRGCIGNLYAEGTVVEGVRQNAINAAFNDPRFPPLSESELSDIDIEVSILSVPQPLDCKDGDDLIDKLRVDVDGVILKKGFLSATFLPQVWKQLPKAEVFLSHLCVKAGLPANEWKNNELEVRTYQVQYFEE